MKSIYSTIILSCALFVGCTNDELVSEGISSEGQGIKVTASLGNQSRITYEQGENGTVKTLWDANDFIGLSHANQSNLKYIADAAGTTTTFAKADVELTAADGVTVYAYYPYTKSTTGTSAYVKENWCQLWQGNNKAPLAVDPSGSYGYTVPDESAPLDFMYASGTVSNNTLTLTDFKHAYAFIKLTITEEELYTEETKNDDKYKVVVTTVMDKSGLLSVWSSNSFDMTTSKFGTDAKSTNLDYYIPKRAFNGNTAITCYIAVIPGKVSGPIEFYKYQVGNGRLIGQKDITTETELKAGHIYPVTLGEVEEEENKVSIAGSYTCTYTDKEKNAASFEGTLEKKNNTTYVLKGIPGVLSQTFALDVELTYSSDNHSLTLKGGQEIYGMSTQPNIIWFANSKDCIDFKSNKATFYYDGERTKGTKDSNVTYVAKYSTNSDGKPVFTFQDGGTWESQTVAGFVATMESAPGNKSYRADYAVFDLVMTKKE